MERVPYYSVLEEVESANKKRKEKFTEQAFNNSNLLSQMLAVEGNLYDYVQKYRKSFANEGIDFDMLMKEMSSVSAQVLRLGVIIRQKEKNL
jgi:hypothetical protein